jgi:hypothetical protein
VDRRRANLRLALLIGVFVLALLPNFGTPAVASPRASGQIIASEHSDAFPAQKGGLTHQTAATNIVDAGATGGDTLLFTSDVVDAGQLFDRLGVHWIAAHGTESSLYLETRTSADGLTWSDWSQVSEEEDMTNEYTNEHYAIPAPAGTSRYAQYRVWLTGGDPDDLQKVSLTFLDVNDVNAGPLAQLVNDIVGAFGDFTRSYADAAPTGAPRILTRQDWAADEGLMNWPPRYQKVQKFVVHHTVTDDGGTNVAASIRSIYYYHAVTRGWGDIGYNYIVDKFGNIWTGRQGGDNVIAGHAYGWNNGSIGIAALGDYSTKAPTGQLQGAIANIIAMKSAQFGIQPYGNDLFKHQEQAPDGTWVDVTTTAPNVIGHRDANYLLDHQGGQTACPGNGIYNMLDGLRRQAQAAVVQGYFDMPWIDPQLPKAAFPGAALNVPVVVTNKGANTIPQGTAVSYRMLKNGAVMTQGAAATLAAPIPPGGTATVTVPFTTPVIGSYLVRWDLQSGGQWWNTLKNTPVREMWFNAADWSADWITDNVPKAWVAGETKVISVTVQNDGGRAWPATGTNPVRLGYKWVSNATGNTFPGAQKVNLPSDIQVGQTISLLIPVTAPDYPTNYTMYLDLYKENEFAFADKGIAPDDTPTGVSVDFKATYNVGTLPTFAGGQTATVPVTITNAGRGTIPVTSSFPVNLGYHWYTSTGQTAVWDGARTKLPADLAAGATVTVQAQVTAPPQGGNYSLRFDLVQEGVSWFSNKGVPTGNVPATIAGPFIKSYGAAYTAAPVSVAMARTQATIPITITNNSNFLWSPVGPTPINLGYHWIDSAGRATVWDGTRTKLAADLAPGASANLQATLIYPSAAGTYTLRWDMVEEGVSWFSGKDVRTANQTVEVTPFVTPFYGGSLDVSGTPASFAAGATAYYTVKVQNLSNFTWGSDVNLSYHWLDAAGNAIVWDGVRTGLAGIKPNDLRAVSIRVAPPATTGTYTLRYDLVREGQTWFSGAGMQTPTRSVEIAVAAYAATYQPAAPNATGAPGATITVPVTITNVGDAVWQPGVINPSYHLLTPSGAVFVWDGARTKLAAPLAKGQGAVVLLQVLLPQAAGTYDLQVDLVQEGITWFSGQRIAPARITLSVQ